MKSTNNVQTTEAVNKNAVASQFPEGVNAPTWQSHIIEELSDEAALAVSGGAKKKSWSSDSPYIYEIIGTYG